MPSELLEEFHKDSRMNMELIYFFNFWVAYNLLFIYLYKKIILLNHKS